MQDPEQKDFHYDAIIVRVAPKDDKGRYSLGPNNDMILSVIKARPKIKIIAEVNENVPDMGGDNYITEKMITAKFESRAALAGPPKVPFTEVEKNIGEYIGQLVPSNSYMQMGIGNVFDGVPSGITNHNVRDIKIWSEMFGDPLFDLIQNGNATTAEVGFAYGSGQMYNYLPGYSDQIKIIPTEVVNSPGTIAALEAFHAINTALQVNLRGDTNATHGADGVRISSPGGQVEFMSGAARSKGGKAIIAIRSTAKNGELSTIVLDTYAGAVTTPNESVTHVVTEYGTAQLVGRSESQRAIALINVAHPKFRKELAQQALERRMISEQDVKLIDFKAKALGK
jgi:acyl-CoA hydrolase